jgi:hypothetical protein
MSKRALRAASWLIVAVLAGPLSVAGQDAAASSHTRRVFVGASLSSTTRPAGEQDYHYITPMFGGTTAGIGGTVGVLLTPRFSAAVEISRLGTLSGPFNFDHFLREYATATETETLVGLLARVHPMKGRVRVEPLGGVFFSFEGIVLTDRRSIGGYPNETVTPLPDASGANVFTGVGGGTDVVADLTPHLAVTVSFRFAYFPHRFTYQSAVLDAKSVGIGNRTFQAGVGLRWTFR